MSKTLTEIAQQLKDFDKKVQLIYAFNGTGKTRLSRVLKHLVAPKNEDSDETELSHSKFLYYSAFTEDLFYWDNDLQLGAEPKLTIHPNRFTDWILKDQGQDQNIIANFQRYVNNKLTPHFSADFKEVIFSLERGDNEQPTPLKISKGEESNFIWSIFYTLLEQIITILNEPEEDRTDQFEQLKYIFIDDPVSSLDENHLIELAVSLAALIKLAPPHLKFIITTHNPLFYNVLHNELDLNKKGKKEGCYLLEKLEDGTYKLNVKFGDSNKSFSYHLYLKQTIEKAIIDNQIEKFHFTLLRNLYEKTASFLGYTKWQDLLNTLKKEDGSKEGYLKRIITFSSHRTLSNEEVRYPTEQEKRIVKILLDNLINNYGYWSEEESTNDNED